MEAYASEEVIAGKGESMDKKTSVGR